MKQGLKVNVVLQSTKTPSEQRKPTWASVTGELLFDVKVGGSIMVERTDPDPHPFWQTSQVRSVRDVGGGVTEVCTLNSVYLVKEAK